MDDAAELALITAYVAARNDEDMTDPESRAARMAAAAGDLSTAWGSFKGPKPDVRADITES
jgi:hypothetical protein